MFKFSHFREQQSKAFLRRLAAGFLLLVALLLATSNVFAWFDTTADGYLQSSPANGRLGYTNGTDVRAWTLDMRWNTTYYIRRDNSPRIDITADCTNGLSDQLHVKSWYSNLPGTSFQSWSDCGNVLIKEEGEIFFNKNSISTSVTNYEADVIFEKKLSSASGEVNHTYQRSSGSDPKVGCPSPCSNPNHDWLAKTVYTNYNYDYFSPTNAGWTKIFEPGSAYAADLPIREAPFFKELNTPDVPFVIQVTQDGIFTRSYIEVDFSDPVALQAYTQWNKAQVKALSWRPGQPLYVKVTFKSPISITNAQELIDAAELSLTQITFVGRNATGQPYSGGTVNDQAESIIQLGALESVFKEKEIALDGVMVIEGFLDPHKSFQTLLNTPEVFLVDVTADYSRQQVEIAGINDLQGVVVFSPYWDLYLAWLK